MTEALTKIDLELPRLSSGKVREIFELDGDRLLFVATDRISAFDVVMTQGIPDKGKVLTAMTRYWLDFLEEVCPHHLISVNLADLEMELPEELAGRSMVVDRLEMLPVEFVVRGYLAGSGWKDYQKTGAVCGVPLPGGLRQADRLPEPIFTPATKATEGHDINISEDEAAELCGPERLKGGKEYALELYSRAAEHAWARGIILADTKFEFGVRHGEVVLGDEVLTCDSSRFWPAEEYVPGSSPPSFDKQFVRDFLEELDWDKSPPPPDLPEEVISGTRRRYIEAYETLTGHRIDDYLRGVGDG